MSPKMELVILFVSFLRTIWDSALVLWFSILFYQFLHLSLSHFHYNIYPFLLEVSLYICHSNHPECPFHISILLLYLCFVYLILISFYVFYLWLIVFGPYNCLYTDRL